jgi:LysM domain
MRLNPTLVLVRTLVFAVCTAAPSLAGAQNGPASAGNAGDDESGVSPPSGPGVTIVQVPSAPGPPGYPGNLPPPGFNPDAHLPSSSRSTRDTSSSTDGFDLNNQDTGPSSVHGSSNGAFQREGSFVPEAHTVRRGETLWEISSRYYQNPYAWPRLWSYNSQIQNPHWIYPGDHVRLRDASVAASVNKLSLLGRRSVPAGTIFLRDVGWVDDKNDDTWGDLVGSPSDRMMLGEGDDIYVQMGDAHEVKLGDQLTIFLPIRTVSSENASGEMVSIRGTAKIERYNPKTKMARAKIIEALDVIERGNKIGPVGRKFDVVPAVKSDRDLDATILASLYPFHFFGQNQVVFIDRGEKDGVKPGMRFFAVMRGDRWQETLGTIGQTALLRPRTEDDRPAKVDPIPTHMVDDDLLPDETYAELRVMRVRDHTATAFVVHSKHEIERNARLIARKGF